MKIEKGSFELMKQLNQQLIFERIRDDGPISRAEISKRTNLTPPTISKVVAELMDAGFVKETEVGESTGGRRPILVAINPAGGYVVGLKINAEEVGIILVDLQVKYLANDRVRLVSSEPAKVCDQAANLLRETVEKAGIPFSKILGVGLALHGLVDHGTGISLLAPQLQWRHIPIKQMMEERLKIPVSVENDVRLMAAGEMWKGAAKGVKNFAFVNVDYGVGTGIVLDGQIIRGVHNAAGEIGHVQVKLDGQDCYCGKKGCLETIISLKALQGIDGDTIRRTVGIYLGRSVAGMISLLDLQKVILGGRVLQLVPGILEEVQREVDHYVMSWISTNTQIVQSALGYEACVDGAVTMILTEFYERGRLW